MGCESFGVVRFNLDRQKSFGRVFLNRLELEKAFFTCGKVGFIFIWLFIKRLFS